MRQELTHESEREREACPLYTAIAVIDGRWKPMLFQRLLDQPRGFGELHRMLPGVTKGRGGKMSRSWSATLSCVGVFTVAVGLGIASAQSAAQPAGESAASLLGEP
ncbi:MAG TPA: hypothetical protein VFB99_19945 [Vicinamibacterales bacterium]|nr:hypothetical protein [Vicinamibacterales bacterium]